MTALLDGNLLVALTVEEHVHHDVASIWFGTSRSFATCPITQGTLLRVLIRGGVVASVAASILNELVARADHSFWTDDLGYGDVPMERVVGHGQVTDAYLAQLARRRAGTIATLDQGLCAAHPDVAEGVGPAADADRGR